MPRPAAARPTRHRRFYAYGYFGGVYEQEILVYPGINLSDPLRWGYATWEEAHAALQKDVMAEIYEAGNAIRYAYLRHQKTVEKLDAVLALAPGTLIPAPTPLDPGRRVVLSESGGYGRLVPLDEED